MRGFGMRMPMDFEDFRRHRGHSCGRRWGESQDPRPELCGFEYPERHGCPRCERFGPFDLPGHFGPHRRPFGPRHEPFWFHHGPFGRRGQSGPFDFGPFDRRFGCRCGPYSRPSDNESPFERGHQCRPGDNENSFERGHQCSRDARERRTGRSMAKNAATEESGDETVLIQRIVVEKGPRCNSV